MRKMTIFACAALLTSAVALTGCKGDQNEPQQNVPSVTTDINIALPDNATGGAKRMPGNTVQKDNGSSDFQGIKNICLIPFGMQKGDTVMAAHRKLGAKLNNIGPINATSELAATSKAKMYTGVSVPVGTSAFLFYAESKAAGTNFEKGSLTYVEATTTAGTTKFNLEPIQENTSTVTGNAAYIALLAYVQSVADAEDENHVAWKNYTTSINEGFADLFAEYSTIKNFNSFNVQRMMNDLLGTIALSDTALAKNMRTAIKNTAYVDVIAKVGGGDSVVLKSGNNYNNFPANLNLPDGAIAIGYSGGTFGTSTDKKFLDTATVANEMQVAPTELYTYPSSLWYYDNTTIKTSNESEQTALENGTENWTWVLTQYPTLNGAVNSKTRSIALIKPINYAVGRFDVKVKLDGASLNDAALPTAQSVACDGKFTLTGVLVGGQKNVGFDFTPETYPVTSSVYTIYDKVIDPSTIKPSTSFGNANSTLVLETPAAGNAGCDIMIAIELVNGTGKDFIGADGVIPANGKFYLVGKLAADKATTSPKKVFLKDYITTAELNIVDLKHAYNGIPDLRTPTLEIGLSVDLNWKTGTTYSIGL